MNDLETIKAMLDKAKIEYEEGNEPHERPCACRHCEHYPHRAKPARTISVERGYVGFIAQFSFCAAGNLVDVSAWE